VRVTGQLMKDGVPYTAKLDGTQPEMFAVDLIGTVKETKVLYSATVNADGSFRVEGADRRGIPRGTYRIAVLHAGFMGAGGDRFNARFAAEKTPLTIELTEHSRLKIDLTAGTVTK
jgi:hypothetical protein